MYLLEPNAIVHPNVVVGEVAIIGSSLELKDIEPWSINIGSLVEI
jgi:acetyltransferase-like isoleucine patch superfamily enzyme